MSGRFHDSKSEIECAQCGESFYHELTRCPNCGQPVFPDDEEYEPIRDFPRGGELVDQFASSLASLIAVLLGLLVSLAISSGLFFGQRALFGAETFTGFARVFLLLSVPVGALAGGYLAAAVEKDHPRPVGWWVGGLSILITIMLSAFERDLDVEPLFTLETIPWWAATVAAGYWGAEAWRRQQRNVVLKSLFPELPGEKELYDDLMNKIGNDKEKAERLIEFEKQYMPNANRRTLIESAIGRWQRDNS